MIELLLAPHILAGFVALGAAGVAVAAAKGSPLHRRSGNVYVLAMLVVTITTLGLVMLRPNAFLLGIGIFSFYFVFTGWRSAKQRDGRARAIDVSAAFLMAVTALAMAGWGLAGLLDSVGKDRSIILLVFAAIGLSMAISDLRDWRKGPITGKARIARHLTRMLGGSIATITAAVVVNLTFLPQLVGWLGPTALITPLIVWWNVRLLRPHRAPDRKQRMRA
ncbi:hypothetical protein ACFOW6_05370 [Fodinicurvata halophila]|uniref:DUF2306 domain-containing protein n=1 Tax=Fodinicurvata halophila TaxID=1419723 RepID=A0ABV8UJK0_9PROT